MKSQMKVAVMNAKRNVSIEMYDKPSPKAGEVLIKIEVVGVCGSDLHYYSEGKIGDLLVQTPFILGHEAAGTIVEVGSGVENVSVGDRVAIEAGIPCGNCEFCRQGKYNLCPDVRFLATPPIDGVFAEYAAYPAQWVYKLPDSMTSTEGVLIEPLAVGMHSSAIAEASVGQTAFIFGCGCIGLVTLLALKSRGVSKVYMCDLIPIRMQKALELGAERVFDVRKDDVVAQMLDITKGRGVDCVFEMTGAKSAVQQTVKIIKKGGNIVLVGLGADSEIPFNFGQLIWNEAQIRTCFRYRSIYPLAIEAVSSKLIPVSKIVSDTCKLDDISAALEYHVEHKNDIIKMVIEM